MHTEKREDPLVELGYEIRDINMSALMKALIGFFLFAVLSSIAGYVILRMMNPAAYAETKPRNRVMPLAPNPMVQSNIAAKTDIMDIRQQEDKLLNQPAGWVDSSHTKAHIPIEKAMAIIAERGVPKTSSEVPAVSKGHTPDPAIGEQPVQGTAKGPLTVPTGAGASVDLKLAKPAAESKKPPTKN